MTRVNEAMTTNHDNLHDMRKQSQVTSRMITMSISFGNEHKHMYFHVQRLDRFFFRHASRLYFLCELINKHVCKVFV